MVEKPMLAVFIVTCALGLESSRL